MRTYHIFLLLLLCAILLSHSPAKSATIVSQRVAPAAEPTIEHIGRVETPWLGHLVSTGMYAYGINPSHTMEIIDLS